MLEETAANWQKPLEKYSSLCYLRNPTYFSHLVTHFFHHTLISVLLCFIFLTSHSGSKSVTYLHWASLEKLIFFLQIPGQYILSFWCDNVYKQKIRKKNIFPQENMLNRSIHFRLQPSHLLVKQMNFIYKISRTWDVTIKAESDLHWVCEYDLKQNFLSPHGKHIKM